MDFDDIIPILGIIATILGFFFKNDKKKDQKKEIKNKRNIKDLSKGFSYIKEMGKSLKEEISSTLENSQPAHKEYKERTKFQGQIQNDEKINEKDIQNNIIFEASVENKKILSKEKIEDVINENEIGKEIFVLNKKNIINGIIMSEILQKPKSLRR